MTTLCITGIPGRDFELVSNVIFDAGLVRAKPVKRETTISIYEWHKRVTPVLARQKSAGRLWEQLAGDLLLANMHETQWGWADTASLDALEFWAELEPGLNFLLLVSDPEDFVAHCMLNDHGEGAGESNEQVYLKLWRDQHKRMLEFYLGNPEHCLLVNARQARANPEALREKLSERFGLDLNGSTAQLPVIQGESRNEAPLSLAYFVAQKTLQNKGKELTQLHDEVLAAQYPLAEPNAEWDKEGNIVGSAKLSLASILRDYQKRCALDLSESERQALNQLRKDNEELLAKLRSVQEQLEESTANQTQLEQKLAEIKALPAADPQQEAELEKQKQENELLLQQLHHVQVELESSFSIKHDLEKSRETLEEENKAIREELSRANSETGEYFKVNQRLKEIQEQFSEAKQENELLLLQLRQVQDELEHYFTKHQELTEEKLATDNENRHVKQQLKQLQATNQQLNQSWLSRFIKPQKFVSELEYEAVELLHEQVNNDYEHLWISLKKPGFGDDTAKQWNFRISCAGVKPGTFGLQPKLELPEQSEQLLHHWFEESTSDDGPKLELRFAQPSSMDKGVWQQIAVQDQQLISALLKQLPSILDDLKVRGTFISRSWEDWQQLVADMNRIHQAKTAR